MAKDTDLFAPPSDDELAMFAAPSKEETDLFAPPSAEESAMFAPPSKEELGQSSMSGEAESGIGGIAGYLAGKGLVEAAGSDRVKEMANLLAYRGVGGRTTSEGKKFYTDSLGKNLSPDMVNITPSSVGRQVLDEGILGTFGLASPEDQLIKQRQVSQSKAMDKNNFLAKIDQPGAIDKAALLAEYEKSVNPTGLDTAVDMNRKVVSGFEKDVPGFSGYQSIIDNEAAKSDLQSRSNYGDTSKESARQLLDKKQAEVRRLASEDAVKAQLGQAGQDEFLGLKTRSGNASVAEKIIAKNALTDGTNPGTINKLSKLAGEAVLEKLPAFGAKTLDAVQKVANNPGVKKAVPFLGTAMGLANGSTAEAAEGALGDVPVVGQAYEALRSDDAGSSTDDRMMIAEREAAKNYNSSAAYTDRMSQFTKSTPEQLDQLATDLEMEGSRFAAPVVKAMASDPVKRTAALYGLYQQPAFRELVNKHNKKKSAF